MRCGVAILERYLEYGRVGGNGIVYKGRRIRVSHHIRGAWASRLWVRVIIRDFGK
jgi:hypothetical protein